jgi:hypothetical protein
MQKSREVVRKRPTRRQELEIQAPSGSSNKQAHNEIQESKLKIESQAKWEPLCRTLVRNYWENERVYELVVGTAVRGRRVVLEG